MFSLSLAIPAIVVLSFVSFGGRGAEMPVFG